MIGRPWPATHFECMATREGSGCPASRERTTVSIDKSLKKLGGMVRSRSVLTRDERIGQLMKEGRWQEGQSPLGLPKVLVERVVGGKQKKKKDDEDESEGTEETTETPAD